MFFYICFVFLHLFLYMCLCLLFTEQEDSHENSKLNKTETENVENVDSLTVDSDDNSAFTTESHSYDWKSGEPLTCDFQVSVFYH